MESVTAGGRIRRLRTIRGMKQGELGRPRYSTSYVSMIECGKRTPDQRFLEFVAPRLDTTVYYLFHGVEPEVIGLQRLQLQSGQHSLSTGDLPAARQQFTELTAAGLQEVRNQALWGLAQVEERSGDLETAVALLEILEKPCRRAEPGTPGQLQFLTARCRLYCTAGDYCRAIEFGESALEHVDELGLAGTEDHVRLVSALVGCYWNRGDLLSADRLATQAIAGAAELGTRRVQAEAYWNACLVAKARGELSQALDLSSRALQMMADGSADGARAGLAVMRAWLLLRCDPPRLDEADVELARAHEAMERESSSDLASCEIEMARSRLLRGDPGEGIRLAEHAIATSVSHGSWSVAEHARVVRGIALIMSGCTDQGVANVTSGAAGLESLGERLEAARAWRDMAEVLLARNHSAMGLDAMRQAADLAGASPFLIRAVTGQRAGATQKRVSHAGPAASRALAMPQQPSLSLVKIKP